MFAWIRVEGLDRLAGVEGPVVFAANHQSHLDGPVVLAALPRARRARVAIAAAREWFGAHFHPERHSRRQRFSKGLSYRLAVLCFNVVPLPQREAGARETLRYLGELVEGGASVLIFPEGRRTREGEIAPFQPGVGMIASRLRLPVVPVRIEGLDRVLHQSWRMARPGRVRVAFGAPHVPATTTAPPRAASRRPCGGCSAAEPRCRSPSPAQLFGRWRLRRFAGWLPGEDPRDYEVQRALECVDPARQPVHLAVDYQNTDRADQGEHGGEDIEHRGVHLYHRRSRLL